MIDPCHQGIAFAFGKSKGLPESIGVSTGFRLGLLDALSRIALGAPGNVARLCDFAPLGLGIVFVFPHPGLRPGLTEGGPLGLRHSVRRWRGDPRLRCVTPLASEMVRCTHPTEQIAPLRG
jgi:hypothetical protein